MTVLFRNNVKQRIRDKRTVRYLKRPQSVPRVSWDAPPFLHTANERAQRYLAAKQLVSKVYAWIVDGNNIKSVHLYGENHSRFPPQTCRLRRPNLQELPMLRKPNS